MLECFEFLYWLGNLSYVVMDVELGDFVGCMCIGIDYGCGDDGYFFFCYFVVVDM